jgi:hypothetical protein
MSDPKFRSLRLVSRFLAGIGTAAVGVALIAGSGSFAFASEPLSAASCDCIFDKFPYYCPDLNPGDACPGEDYCETCVCEDVDPWIGWVCVQP